MSYSRDSGAPAYGDANTNILVDFAFGNMPIQPNEDRGEFQSGLDTLDSHKIALTQWDMYPQHNGSRNYMITAAKALGGSNYEYTSQNNLIVGEQIKISGCGWASTASPYVTYADATKFRISDDLADSTDLTGLTGRVDVIETDTGQTLYDNGALFSWPSMGVCTNDWKELQVDPYQEFFKSVGVNPALLKDFTFSGGTTEWDYAGTPNYDGNIFYYYVPAEEVMGQTWDGQIIYGSNFDGIVLYGDHNAGEPVPVDGAWYQYALIVFTNDPRKNTHVWWDL
jgi:hypothetical protein